MAEASVSAPALSPTSNSTSINSRPRLPLSSPSSFTYMVEASVSAPALGPIARTTVSVPLELLARLLELLFPSRLNYCFRLALELQAVILSPDYRLTPKNRLPAAIEDGFVAVEWLKAQAVAYEPDRWLTDVANIGNVFVSGDSDGGNIGHHLAVRLEHFGVIELKLV